MGDDRAVPRPFSPATPRSSRLGKALRKLREAKGLTTEQVAKSDLVKRSQPWVSRVEQGKIKPRWGQVVELLTLYGLSPDSKEYRDLIELAKTLGEDGWWQRLDALSTSLLQFIGFEAEAETILIWEPILIPGLFQTEAYARAVSGLGRETDPEKIDQKVKARLNRQQILTRKPSPPFVHAVISEAALLCQVGGETVLREQIQHIIGLSARPNVRVQVLRFQAGAHLADRGAFNILGFGEGDPDLGFVDTVTGALFLESANDIGWLSSIWSDITMRSMSPAESVQYMNGLVK